MDTSISKPNALERMRLGRREMPRVVGRLRALCASRAIPSLLAGVGASVGVGWQARHFAQALLARYGVLPGHVSPPDLSYHSWATGSQVMLQRITHNHPLSLSLRLALTLLEWPAMSDRMGAAGRAGTRAIAGPLRDSPSLSPVRSPQVLLRLASVRPPAQAEAHPGDEVAVPPDQGRGVHPPLHGDEATVEAAAQAGIVHPPLHGDEPSWDRLVRAAQEQGRITLAVARPEVAQTLVRRAERIPMLAVNSALHPPAGPVSRVVHRPAPAYAAEGDAPSAVSRTRRNAPRTIPWPANGSQQEPALDQFQLHRLADQVVRVIDDRIVARRERMGRA